MLLEKQSLFIVYTVGVDYVKEVGIYTNHYALKG
jgi:hypothetical protein